MPGPCSPRPLIFSADAESTDLYTWEAMAEAAAAMPTPMREPARPIWDESANDVTDARADATTAVMEKSSNRLFLVVLSGPSSPDETLVCCGSMRVATFLRASARRCRSRAFRSARRPFGAS